MRQAKKKHPSVINSCNSSDGSVVAWLHAASASAKTKYRKIMINTKKELDLSLQQELNAKATHSLRHGLLSKFHHAKY